MRIRTLILSVAVATATLAVAVNSFAPSGALINDEPDPCSKTKNWPSNANLITGTAGPDVLFGTDGNDVIRGLDGEDVIFGGKGNDMLCGGMKADTIYGGKGRDRMWGGWGNDCFDGGGGDDQITGGPDGNTVNFHSAQAPVWLHTGKSQYRVGNGPLERIVEVQRIEGSLWSDTIDVLDGKRHFVQGGSGDDKMTGDDLYGGDNLNGGPDDDKCRYDRKKQYYNCA